MARRVNCRLGIPFHPRRMRLSLLGRFGTKTGAGHLQPDGVGDAPVKGGRCRPGVLEKAIPWTEPAGTADEYPFTFVPFGQKSNYTLHGSVPDLDFTPKPRIHID